MTTEKLCISVNMTVRVSEQELGAYEPVFLFCVCVCVCDINEFYYHPGLASEGRSLTLRSIRCKICVLTSCIIYSTLFVSLIFLIIFVNLSHIDILTGLCLFAYFLTKYMILKNVCMCNYM